MPVVSQREAARRDLVEHFIYLAENAGLDVADRFLSCAEASFADLVREPMMGAPIALKHPDLANIRKWRVKDFDHHLVFYEPRPRRRVHRARAACSQRLVGPVGSGRVAGPTATVEAP